MTRGSPSSGESISRRASMTFSRRLVAAPALLQTRPAPILARPWWVIGAAKRCPRPNPCSSGCTYEHWPRRACGVCSAHRRPRVRWRCGAARRCASPRSEARPCSGRRDPCFGAAAPSDGRRPTQIDFMDRCGRGHRATTAKARPRARSSGRPGRRTRDRATLDRAAVGIAAAAPRLH